jgi:hypothetical protein
LPKGCEQRFHPEHARQRYCSYECRQAAHLLYKIIASRYQKHSTTLVTNMDFDKWGEYLSDGPRADVDVLLFCHL